MTRLRKIAGAAAAIAALLLVAPSSEAQVNKKQIAQVTTPKTNRIIVISRRWRNACANTAWRLAPRRANVWALS